jgi:hypothetical protein
MTSVKTLPFGYGEWRLGKLDGDIYFSTFDALKQAIEEMNAKISDLGNIQVPFFSGSLKLSDDELILQPYKNSMENVTQLNLFTICKGGYPRKGVISLQVETNDCSDKDDIWIYAMESLFTETSLSFCNVLHNRNDYEYKWVLFTDVVNALYAATKLDMSDFLMGTRSSNTPIYRAFRHRLCDHQIFRLLSKF